tara:strand:+ start:101 stop:484 length:384 start_codon:yes stop_codon:yes gene_type:complete
MGIKNILLIIIMDIIISKLKLPDDMKYEINKYCYDDLGYTNDEINKIDSYKINFCKNKLYLKIELLCWIHSGLSIQWLKSTNNSKSGYFSSIIDIKDGLNYCFINKLITSDEWFLLAKDLGDIMFLS